MKYIFVIISMFLCVSLWGQNPVQQSVDEIVADPAFAQAVVGVCVMDADGNLTEEEVKAPVAPKRRFR